MSFKQKNIFVVDDDEMVAAMFSDHLKENPLYNVYTFSTGEECIANLHLDPDVILLDYTLNAIKHDAADGRQILKQIRELDKEVHVIMLSSLDDYGKALQTIMEGAVEFVVKDNNAFKRIDHILAG